MDAGLLINKDYIFNNYTAVSRDDLMTKLGTKLREGGFVKDTFIEAIIHRENHYPTGLPTGTLKIAIPHTDVKHVEKPCICIAKLRQPVEFQAMGNNKQTIPIDMVFMLALSDPKSHLRILQKIIQLFSDKEVLEALKAARASARIYQILIEAVEQSK